MTVIAEVLTWVRLTPKSTLSLLPSVYFHCTDPNESTWKYGSSWILTHFSFLVAFLVPHNRTHLLKVKLWGLLNSWLCNTKIFTTFSSQKSPEKNKNLGQKCKFIFEKKILDGIWPQLTKYEDGKNIEKSNYSP